MARFSLVLVGAALVAVVAPSQLRADFLTGKTLGYEYLVPDKNTPLAGSTTQFVVGPGNELTDLGFGGAVATVDVGDESIFMEFSGSGDAPPGSFSGLHFFDVNNSIAPFGTFAIVEDDLGVTLSFDADNLYVNATGTSFAPNDVVSLRVAAVPEPSSLVLFGLVSVVLAGSGIYKRRLAMLSA